MIDQNGNDFIQRKGVFLANRKDRGNRFFMNFSEGGDKGIPSRGFKKAISPLVVGPLQINTDSRL